MTMEVYNGNFIDLQSSGFTFSLGFAIIHHVKNDG